MRRTCQHIICVLLLLLAGNKQATAQAPSESDLVRRIVASFVSADSMAYASVFPNVDTIIAITLREAGQETPLYQETLQLQGDRDRKNEQDSLIRRNAYVLHNFIYERGLGLGIHWSDVLMNRYELQALPKSNNPALEAIAPERFVGFLFLEDMQTRRFYTVALSDIRKMGGNWYGGEANYIFEARDRDEFNVKLKADKKRILKGLADSALITHRAPPDSTDDEAEPDNKRKQVVDRKYYSGYLDDDIPIKLYIRYIKGDCPGGVCSYDAMIRFEDENFAMFEASKTKEGKWTFIEESTGGVLELTLNGTEFNGSFFASADRVDYDAKLKEKNLTKKKLELLDAIMDEDLSH
jgi:hypothetical protein